MIKSPYIIPLEKEKTMEVILYALLLIFVFFVIKNCTYRARTIRVAIKALQKTTDSFPEDSTEYFPPKHIIKATLEQNLNLEATKKALKPAYSNMSPEIEAYHLLDYVGKLFVHEKNPHMGQWHLAAKETLQKYVDNSRKF